MIESMKKRCFRCGKRKALAEFYAHPMMADGRLGKCKECTKGDVSANYRATKTAKQAYERERNKRPERKLARLRYARNRRERDPDRALARSRVFYAIKSGKLERKPCRVCGEKAQAHHEDYSKPLDVDWLCFKHHRQVHGQLRDEAA